MCSGSVCLICVAVALLVFVPGLVSAPEAPAADQAVSPPACPSPSYSKTYPFQKTVTGAGAECCKWKTLTECIQLKKTGQTWAVQPPARPGKPETPKPAKPVDPKPVPGFVSPKQPQCPVNLDIRVYDTLLGYADKRCYQIPNGNSNITQAELRSKHLVKECWLGDYYCDSVSEYDRTKPPVVCPADLRWHDDGKCWAHAANDGPITQLTISACQSQCKNA